MHYRRWKRGGDLTKPPQVKIPGGTQGQCIAPDCDADAFTKNMCRKHFERVKNHGATDVVLKTGRKPGFASEDHPMWRGDDVAYHGVHKRVAAKLKAARHHTCVDCGQTAEHWSYNHKDPEEKQSNLGPYSLKAEFYEPRCVSCHKRFDLAQLDRSQTVS